MKRKVLLIENNEDVRDALKGFLEYNGYDVYTADNFEKVFKKDFDKDTRNDRVKNFLEDFLKKNWVHLAIIDLRLEDDSDLGDFSGIDFVKALDTAIAKIIMTGYDSVASLKQLLEPDSEGKVEEFYFVEKKDGPKELLDKVNLAFEHKIKIDPGFDIYHGNKIRSNEIFNYDRAIDELFPEVGPNQTNRDEIREKFYEEIEEIFRRLFYRSKKIKISLLKGGLSGASAVKVEPEYDDGLSNEVVVKFGLREYIEEEENNIQRYVKRFMGGMRSTFVLDSAHTANFRGTAYTFIGLPFENATSFEDYYNSNDSDYIKIKEAIANIFNQTCKSWYANKSKPTTKNLLEYYESEESLRKDIIISNYHKYASDNPGFVRIKCEERFKAFIEDVWSKKESQFDISTYCSCITHGDLNRNNILLDKNGNAWLIDFYRTRLSYALRDFVRLETTIKFELLKMNDIKALKMFEKELIKYNYYDDFKTQYDNSKASDLDFAKSDDNLVKAFFAIKEIRYWAHEKVGLSDMREYYIALLFQTLKYLTWESTWHTYNAEHILASSIIIGDKLLGTK